MRQVQGSCAALITYLFAWAFVQGLHNAAFEDMSHRKFDKEGCRSQVASLLLYQQQALRLHSTICKVVHTMTEAGFKKLDMLQLAACLSMAKTRSSQSSRCQNPTHVLDDCAVLIRLPWLTPYWTAWLQPQDSCCQLWRLSKGTMSL